MSKSMHYILIFKKYILYQKKVSLIIKQVSLLVTIFISVGYAKTNNTDEFMNFCIKTTTKSEIYTLNIVADTSVDFLTDELGIAPRKAKSNTSKNIREKMCQEIAKKFVHNKEKRTLYLSKKNITDLTPLHYLDGVNGLILNYNPISSISVLRHMDLITLSLNGTLINNISTIKYFTELKTLKLLNTPNIFDINPISGLVHLEYLTISKGHKNIQNVKFPETLSVLEISQIELRNIKPLMHLKKLSSLKLKNTGLKNIIDIKYLNKLQDLKIVNQPLSDITPLQNLTLLQSLVLNEINIDNIKALKDLKNLRRLGIGRTNVTDLSILSGKNISLNSKYNPLKKCSPKNTQDLYNFVTCIKEKVENTITKKDQITFLKTILQEMVHIKGGSFFMGTYMEEKEILENLPKNVRDYMDSKEAKDQSFYFTETYAWPRHKVTLASYHIAKFETSWKEYDFYTKAKKLQFIEPKKKKRKDADRLAEKSANLGWHQANQYCKWLSKVSGLPFSLPTEAQWEYAATNRGKFIPYGTDTGYWEKGVNIYSDADKKKNMFAKDTRYPPNPLGIYHLADSMSEWTSDWFAKYSKKEQVNPKGPKIGTHKISRGASWGDSPGNNSNWSRYPSEILLSDRSMKFRKDSLQQQPTREDADHMDDGVRCVLNLDRPITQKDIDSVK